MTADADHPRCFASQIGNQVAGPSGRDVKRLCYLVTLNPVLLQQAPVCHNDIQGLAGILADTYRNKTGIMVGLSGIMNIVTRGKVLLFLRVYYQGT